MLTTTFTAGDTFAATEPLPDYPASAGWVAKLRLIAQAGAGAPIELVSAASGDDHAFTAVPATTAAWVAGPYTTVLWVERAGEKHTVSQARLTIAPDPRTITAGTDLRSLPRKTLDDLLAARAEWARTQGRVRRYKIADREREFASAAELNQEIAFWEGQLANEDAATRLASGLRPRNRLFVRFTRPR